MSPCARLAILLVLLGVSACGDDDDDDADPDAGMAEVDAQTGCRGRGDCDQASGLSCYGPDDTHCGIPPHEECASDLDCGEGSVCHAIFDSCSPDDIGSMCDSPCEGDACGPGFVCTPAAHCEPAPCGENADCAQPQTCDPSSVDRDGPVHAITSGCVAIPCGNDLGCPTDTFCVNGRCQSAIGTCSPPAP